MSRTIKGSKGIGYEFWGRRPMCGGSGPTAKLWAHRKERRRAAEQLRRDPEAVRNREAF